MAIRGILMVVGASFTRLMGTEGNAARVTVVSRKCQKMQKETGRWRLVPEARVAASAAASALD